VRDAMDRLIPDVAGAGAARADVIIEAIFENLEAKRALFAKLEAQAKPDAILATNTSSLKLADIATSLKDPSRLVGIHFFNPVPQLQLVEVVSSSQTNPESAKKAAAFVRQIDKLPLPVRDAPGFLVNRVLGPYMYNAFRMLDQGVKPETLDRARGQVLHEHVGLRHEFLQDRARRRMLDVEGQALLRAVGPGELARHPVHHIIIIAAEIAFAGPLDLDDPRTPVGQMPAGERCRDGLLQRDHGDAG